MDQFFFPDKLNGESTCRKQIDVMLNSMDEKELIVMESTAEGLKKARGTKEAYACCETVNTDFKEKDGKGMERKREQDESEYLQNAAIR